MARVLVIYKSGAQIEVKCKDCSFRKDGGRLISISRELT